MKNTNLENEEIIVQVERIVRLDSIVKEVKESEEWEETRVTIYDVGFENGETKERRRIIQKMLKQNKSVVEIMDLCECTEEEVLEVQASMTATV